MDTTPTTPAAPGKPTQEIVKQPSTILNRQQMATFIAQGILEAIGKRMGKNFLDVNDCDIAREALKLCDKKLRRHMRAQ